MNAPRLARPWPAALALVGLRWRMVRSRKVRAGLLAGVLLGVAALWLAVPVSRHLPEVAPATTALPVALWVFLVVATVAPLAAGGGYQLFPAEQLTPQPVPARALVRVSLILSPLNLAWYAQIIGLVALVLALQLPAAGAAAAFAFVGAWVGASTVAGQVVSWTVAGMRRTRSGRRTTWLAFAAVLALLYLGRSPIVRFLVDRPSSWIGQSAARSPVPVVLAALALALATFGLLGLADRAGHWTLHRASPDPLPGSSDRPHHRRPDPASPYRARLRADRVSVWRSPPLRRGLLVLGLLPAVSAGVARLDWPSLALLPAFVGSGAALLFGVNAFCLEGTGAVWLASLPHDPRIALLSKAQVILETTGLAILVGMSGGLLRARYAPDALSIAAVGASVLTAVAIVAATCLRSTVTRPHRADLLGPRDTPAPPGTMAVYAARLTFTAGLPAGLFSVFARLGLGWPLLATFLLLTGWAAWSVMGTLRRWSDPRVRARVALTVASG